MLSTKRVGGIRVQAIVVGTGKVKYGSRRERERTAYGLPSTVDYHLDMSGAVALLFQFQCKWSLDLCDQSPIKISVCPGERDV
jgi:hypothetical protein